MPNSTADDKRAPDMGTHSKSSGKASTSANPTVHLKTPPVHYLTRRAHVAITLCIAIVCSCTKDSPYIAIVGDRSGPNKSFGEQLAFGMNYAIGLRPESGESKIRVRYFDDSSDSTQARRVALRLVSDPNVIAVVGHTTSLTTRVGQELYSRYQLPLLAPVASYSQLTVPEMGQQPLNVVRLIASNEQQASLIADHLRDLADNDELMREPSTRQPVVHVFYEPTDYGRDLSRRLERALAAKHLQLRLMTSASLDAQGRIETGAIVGALQAQAVTSAVVFVGYVSQAIDLLRVILGLQVGSPYPIILTDGSKDPQLLRADLGIGNTPIYVTFIAPDWGDIAVDSTLEPEWLRFRRLQSFLSSYQQTGEIARHADAGFAPIAADAVWLLYEIARRYQAEWSSAHDLRQLLLRELRNPDRAHQGLFRDYQFTEAGELAESHAFMFAVERHDGDYLFRQLPVLQHR